MCCNINDFTPHRAGQHSVFTSAENRCTHVGKNKNRHMIRQFKVDGEVVEAGDMSPRCDYLLLNDDAKTSYYIELKGSDLVKAIEQIETTVAMIAPSIPEYAVLRRIVFRTGTHGIQTRPVLSWKRKHGNTVVIKERLLEETI